MTLLREGLCAAGALALIGCSRPPGLDAALPDGAVGLADAPPAPGTDAHRPDAPGPVGPDAATAPDAPAPPDAARPAATESFALNRPNAGPVVRYAPAPAGRPALAAGNETTVAQIRTYVDAGLPEVTVTYPSGATFTVRGAMPSVGGACTWTPSVADNELLPVNCVTWETAMAACAFIGGRLATEAEWERLSGGRPRADDTTGLFARTVVYNGFYLGPQYRSSAAETWVGNVSEWTADVYADYGDARWRDDYETLIVGTGAHTVRGSNYTTPCCDTRESMVPHYVTSRRGETAAGPTIGFRCVFGG